MKNYWLCDGQLYLPGGVIDEGSLEIKDGKIGDIIRGRPPAGVLTFSAGGDRVLPGLVDIHCHGIACGDVMEAGTESLRIIQRELARCGTTAFLSTTMTASRETLLEVAKAVGCRMREQVPEDGARLLGIHLEGPYISPEKAGVQPRDHIRPPDVGELAELQAVSGGAVRLVTLAPELEGCLEFIASLSRQGVVVSAGHTMASYEQTLEAKQAGLNGVTHLFNCIGELHHREPGAAGAALDTDLYVELIADGVHLHPAILRLVTRTKNRSDIILVSDCLATIGCGLNGTPLEVRDEVVFLPGGKLAGSALPLAGQLKKMILFTGIPMASAVDFVSINPVRVLGMNREIGTIAPGQAANFTIMNENLEVVFTVVEGVIFPGAV